MQLVVLLVVQCRQCRVVPGIDFKAGDRLHITDAQRTDRDQVAVHNDVASTVDLILRGGVPRPELRRREEDGEGADARQDALRRRGRPARPVTRAHGQGNCAHA